MNSFRLPLLFVTVFAALVSATSTSAADKRAPNFVVLFADDMGYADTGAFGHPTIKTPRLDRMANEGLKLTSFYVASSVCTPSRAGLLTGRYPVRSGMADNPKAGANVLYPNSKTGLPTDEITIATALKQKDYATALIGKWHLGHVHKHLPTSHGFDYYYGVPYSNDMHLDPDLPRHKYGMDPNGDSDRWNTPLMRNDKVIEEATDQNTLTQRYTEESVRFIRENRDEPFFLYVAYAMPHVPLFASDKFRDTSARGRYGDTIEEIDWSAGKIMDTLEELGLDESTIVIFTSDNGPWLKKRFAGGSAGMLRDGKGGTWEGGLRVPAIAWWPSKIAPGRVSSEIGSTIDLLPTFLSLAGAEVPSDREIDGVDLTDFLVGKSEASPREEMIYYRGYEIYAVRKGAYKAHFVTYEGYSGKEPARHDPPLLFNVDQDPGEQYNIAEEHPEVVAELIQLAEEHRANMVHGEPQVLPGVGDPIKPGTKL